jgi:uncharacterized protein (TIGR00369 family)
MPPFEAANPNFEADVRASFSQQGIMRAIGAELIVVRPGLCGIRLPFSDGVSQQHGYFHGGLVATIADSAGGYAAMTLCPPGSEVLTVEYKVNFLMPAKGTEVVATGRVVKNGRTLIISQIEVEARNGGTTTVCAMMQQTMMAVVPRSGSGASASPA